MDMEEVDNSGNENVYSIATPQLEESITINVGK
jgi:hypothetical protein